jgi:biofilm PGA synthesis N-glycosyltransferase PgaC
MFTAFFIIWSFLSLAYAGLLLYYRHLWKKVPLYIPKQKTKNPVFISVIIAARNEEKNIGRLLDSLFKQTYDKSFFEIIVVDDHSTDRTAEVVSQTDASIIRLLKLAELINGEQVFAYKKKAIEKGISQARGELIVTTDADCIVSPQWLETISAYYEAYRPKMMVMPVKIAPHQTALEKFQALDFMMLQGITGGAVHSGWHSMCNGANLAYTKASFESVKGFEGIDKVASGDDMLLMEKLKEKYPDRIHYLLSENVVVKTAAAAGIHSFLQQRIRWAGKTKAYREKTILPVLILVYVYNLVMLAGLLWTLRLPSISVSQEWVWPAFVIWLGMAGWKTLFEKILLWPVTGFFGERKGMLFFPLIQPIHILYTVVAGTFSLWGKSEWKGRKIH